ncbi:MAG: alanine--tRNA ligase [Fusobacteria bacterium]|nr:alanine--tRNA ligase [Fusobacteriota bacterium]
MYTTGELRERFLKYFEANDHMRIASSSLVPGDDPTLMFVNAGMVQFKNVFLGLEERNYKRATSSQKCLRISGKHNDFEAVGRTPRHHTFFEMLGNFSFGDYFKEEAIILAWNFITKELKIDKDKLWITIYEKDDEAGEIWKNVTDIDPDKIVKLGEKDNFWSMGDVGPCGPCTEIHYDRGEEFSCGPDCGLGKCECDRITEIWNLVFMEFNRDESGEMSKLPKPSVDTGMGLERIAAIMQGVNSNYDTDIFQPLIHKVEEISGQKYQKDHSGFQFRVIADHIRASSFLIADGVLPSNEGRGYILRRIIRRAIRYGKTIGLEKPFLYTIVDTLIETMDDAYPELIEKEDFIKKVLKVEEKRFLETLNDGMIMAEKIMFNMKDEGRREMSGEEAFLLYDTYGFPVELTEDLLEENDYTIDKDAYLIAMERQKEINRRESNNNEFNQNINLSNEFVKLSDTVFTGYSNTAAEGKILGIFSSNGDKLSVLEKGNLGIVIFDKTPFYGESGGQIGDKGYLSKNEEKIAKVLDAKKSTEGRIYHIVESIEKIEINDIVKLSLDDGRRKSIMRNHSATHLLHRALNEVLGEHANQKGSYVDDKYLRFDFSHFENLTKDELSRIEDLVNEYILSGSDVTTQLLPIDEAKKVGAKAIFGEKYGDDVRVVKMGDISIEFCGGTHVSNTCQIGSFKIISEASIGAGLRRIEACTGLEVIRRDREKDSILHKISTQLKVPKNEFYHKIEALQKELKDIQGEKNKLSLELAKIKAVNVADRVELIKGIPVLLEELEGKSMDELRALADLYRDKNGSVLVVLAAKENNKVNLLVSATKDLVAKNINAGKIIKEIAPIVGGGGGGRPDMAQAGGKLPDKIQEALNKVKVII